MHFSRIRLDEESLRDGSAWRGMSDAYSLHQIVWDFFADADDRKRDFLYRHDAVGRSPAFYAVSERPPRESPGWIVETKAYAPAIKDGDRFDFELRANPTRRRKNPDGTDNGSRHDVVMDAKYRRRRGNGVDGGIETEAELVQVECGRWLSDRAERHGFRFGESAIRADGYRQHRFAKRNGGKPLQVSSVDFTGRLEVTDSARFVETLGTGIGPAKGFGFGLLMLRRR